MVGRARTDNIVSVNEYEEMKMSNILFEKTDDEFVLEVVFIENHGRILIDHCMIF
tara:strand:+ start:263 stop:427 length:165 start_codon:yes stop_codon:yes gene_type:complete